MDQSHSLPRHALLVLKLFGVFFLTAVLLLSMVAAFGAGPIDANAAPAAQGTTFDCRTVTQIPQKECQALVSLYNDTDGAHWFTSTGWLQNTAACSWYGVTCGEGHVTELDLRSNNLSGTIPSS